MTVVADAGPLIALAKIEKVHLLHDLYQQVVTGPAVYTEAVTAGLAMNAADADVLNEAYQQGHLVVRPPSSIPLPQPGLLHAGEAESIRLAIELQAERIVWIERILSCLAASTVTRFFLLAICLFCGTLSAIP
jgi:predicted nucleic acid-binding protein